jgi:hypothetical protein
MRYGKKITPATLNVLNNAIKKLDGDYGEVLAHWNECTPEQKKAFIEHSPVLKRIIDWSNQWQQEQV